MMLLSPRLIPVVDCLLQHLLIVQLGHRLLQEEEVQQGELVFLQFELLGSMTMRNEKGRIAKMVGFVTVVKLYSFVSESDHRERKAQNGSSSKKR
jgi:hypothetical protein